MSVLIKGLHMPAEGNETIIRIQPNGVILDQYGHHLLQKAVYVPPHGDLIGRNALVAAYDAEHVGPPGRARELMMEAPTIIPAEGVSEG